MKRWLIIFFTSLVYLIPSPVSAHSFGKLYNLPVPFWMYMYGGVAALLVSFLIIGFFISRTSTSITYPTRALPNFFISKRFLSTLKLVSVLLFLFTILSGFIGKNSAYSNFNMTFFWIIFVLGLTYLTAFFGNVYAIVNPWKVIAEWVEKFFGQKAKGFISYPKNLTYYPALILYFVFIWIELLGQTEPKSLSLIIAQYTMLNVYGVLLVGKENWFRYCEFFSVFFRLIGKIAPLELVPSANKKSVRLQLRPPFVGLVKNNAEHFSLLLFILFMLSSTAFDGFRSTTPFYRLYWQNLDTIVRPIFADRSYEIYQTIALLLSPFIFLFIYLVFIALTKIITRSNLSIKEIALRFAFSLIPIAFVYNIAHYYTLILIEGQNFITILSDPFGFGWNLFNTAGYATNLSVADAGITWHVQVTLILIGHIISVYLAHVIALNVFPSHKKALLSQIPMLLLMVFYTVIGLWILSQPV